MSKIYSFEFSGTKEMFLNLLSKFPNNNNSFYYFDDYIIAITENEMRFGIARGGHSGGYWFIPTIAEYDNKITFCGRIQYIDSYTGERGVSIIINNIGNFLLFVLILPVIFIVKAYICLSRIVRKIIKRPKPKTESTEDRLFALMENYLNCIRK